MVTDFFFLVIITPLGDGRLSLSIARGLKEKFQVCIFLRVIPVMPIQCEWHYIDRQVDHEAVDQMLPPVF